MIVFIDASQRWNAGTKGKKEDEARKRQVDCNARSPLNRLNQTITMGKLWHNSHVFHILHDKKWFKWKHFQRQPMQDTTQCYFVRNCVGACGRP